MKAKQNEIARSLTDLGSQIQGLSITTMSVNETLADSIAAASVRPNSAWNSSPYLLLRILQWLGISPFWMVFIFVLSLPRYAVVQTARALVWFGIKVWSVGTVSQLSGHLSSRFTDFFSIDSYSIPQGSGHLKHRPGNEVGKTYSVSIRDCCSQIRLPEIFSSFISNDDYFKTFETPVKSPPPRYSMTLPMPESPLVSKHRQQPTILYPTARIKAPVLPPTFPRFSRTRPASRIPARLYQSDPLGGPSRH